MTTPLERLRERFASDPADRAAFEALEEHLFLQGDWSALVPIYERHLAATAATRSAIDGARLLYRMGHALDEAGLDPERAERCHRDALEIDPRFAPALRRLRGRCAASGRWQEALALAVREAGGVSRPTERAALLAEVGEGALRGGEPALAAEAFEQALAADAGSRRAWLGIGEALERAGRLEEAAQRWQQALSLALGEGRERALAWRQLGRLLADALGDPAGALAVYEAAHRAAPEEPEWLDAMAGTLRALGRGDALAALAERRIALAGDAEGRAAIALDTGRTLLARGADPAAARAWLQRAADLAESGDVHLALAEAAGRAGDTGGRTMHLERAMELGAEIPSWADLGLGGEPPEPPSDALLERLRHAAAERPADPDALAAYADALEAGHHELERIEVLERLAALAGDPAERIEHLLQLGALHETLDDVAAAGSAYQMAFDLDPGHPQALAALERTLRKLERPAALLATYARAAERAAPVRRAELLCAAGVLQAEGGDPVAANASFAAALAADPGCAAAHDGAARTAAGTDDETLLAAWIAEAPRAGLARLEVLAPELTRRLDALGRGEEALPALRRHAALSPAPREALERLARQLEDLGDTDELSLVLERLDDLLAGAARGANQRRLGWLHAAEGRADAALDAWRAALRHDPSDLASLEALLDAFAEAERFEDALALLDELGTPAGSRSIALRRARALDRGGRPAEAAHAWRELHREGERSEEVLEGWERSARAAGDPELLADALRERAARTSEGDARTRIELERARLLDAALDRPDEARRAWEALADAALPPAAAEEVERRLDALLERTGDYPALCERLEARAEHSTAGPGWLLHMRIADLAEARLGDIGRARRHLEMAIGVAPEHPGPWHRLAALYDEESQPAECLRAFEGELSALANAGDDPELHARRLALHAQAARVATEQLGDGERAADHWRRVLALAPGDPVAGEGLLAHCEANDRFDEAAALLRERLERLGDRPPDAERAADLRRRLADLLAGRLGRRDEAVALLESAPAVGAHADADAERLAALYTESGRHHELAALADARAELATDPRERARWRHRLGGALHATGDAQGAEQAFEAVLADAPDADDARSALCELLRARGEAARLAPQLELALRRAGAHAPALRRELAELYEGPLAAPARALEHWLALCRLDPGAGEPRERAIALASGLGRLDEAAALLEQAASDPATGSARARCWSRCAELLAGPLGRPEEALRAWRESLLLEPEQPGVRHALRRALEALGRPEEALAELHGEWRSARGHARAELAAHGADLAATARPEALASWLARLVAEVPGDPALWEAIAALHRRTGRPAACERALAEAARCAPAPAWRAALQRERAALLAGTLASPEGARLAFEAALADDPGDPGLLAELDRLHATAGRTRERLEVLLARIAHARTASLRAALAAEAAPLASALGELEPAAALWRTALATPPGPERAARLAPATDAFRVARCEEDWIALAEEELATTTLPAERARALRRELARAWWRHARHDRALAHARALADDPEAAGEDHRLLLALLRAEGDAGERARRLLAWAGRAPEEAERCAAWTELARLREERLGLPAAAADAWRELLRLDPDAAEGWSGLRRCAERARDWPELARALEAELARGLGSPAERWRRLGRVRWQALGDAAGAEQALLAARAAEPDELTALRMLQEIMQATAAFPRALALLAEELELLGDADPPRRRALWLSIAAIAHRQAPDPARAADAYGEAHRLGTLGADDLGRWAAVLATAGERERWCEICTAWVDHPDARPAAADLLALAEALAEQGRREDAEQRAGAALALDPALAGAWRLRARLREADGDDPGAAEAWLRAAEQETGLAAAEALARAAALLEAREPLRALGALERAAEHAPDHAPAQAALARLAEQHDRQELALAAATRLLTAEHALGELPDTDRLAALLAGGRAARRLERWPSAWQLGGEALALAPAAPDALAAHGLAAFHLGATGECQRDLAARLALPDPDPARSRLLVALARALETSGELAAALGRHEEALRLDPAHEDAHAGCLRVLERLGRRSEAAAALAAWAVHTPDAARRAERYVRAARLARLASPDAGRVEGWLREALRAEPSHATAWYELVTGLWDEGRHDEAYTAATEGAETVGSTSVRALLESVRGRVLEAREDAPGALAAYRAALAADPEAREAALAAARLLRVAGDWSQAAEVLRRAIEGRGDPAERAELCLELGRLLSGPLEDVPGALAAFDRAHALTPSRLDVREARAALLAHLPERSGEALEDLAAVLDALPLRVEAVRRATRVLAAAGDEPGAARGLALLRALGAASPLESESAPTRMDLACAVALPVLDAHGETLREAVAALAPLADQAAVAPAGTEPESASAAGGACVPPALDAWRSAARDLVGAPDLLGLEPFRLRGALEAMLAEARAGRLGRKGSRAVRRLDPNVLDRLDLGAWRTALRASAWARVADRLGGDLRAVLAAIAAERGAPLDEGADLTVWLGEAPDALVLLRALERAWLTAVR